MPKRTFPAILLAVFAIVPLGSALDAQAPAPVRLLVNAKIFTGDPAHPYAEAVALRGDTILAVGNRPQVEAAAGPNPEILDLGGKTLLPGFIDSHNHAVDGGLLLISASSPEDLTSVDELVKIAAQAKADGRGMYGDVLNVVSIPLNIWSKNDELNARFNTGQFSDQPVFLQGMDYHTGWANLALRKKAGLDDAYLKTLTPTQLAYYGYDPKTLVPNGFAVDEGLHIIEKQVPTADAAKMLRAAHAAVESLHSLGITSWVDPAASPAILAAYRDLAKEGGLTAHVAAFPVVVVNDPDPAKLLAQPLALKQEFDSVPGLTIAGVKVFADGVAEFPSQTAAMDKPYAITGKTGQLLFDPQNFAPFCIAADKAGLIIHIHAIGDRAVTESLNGIEAARKANGPSGLPHTITHLQFVKSSDIARFQQLDVLAAYQLYWAIAGSDTIDILKPYVDPAIYQWQYPARSMLQAGTTITGASDWPVSTANPFLAIYNAETRKGPAGVLDATQDMPRLAMLYAYTINAARALNLQSKIGSIEPGKAADLTLVDRDILTVSPEEMRDTKVLWTMVAGKTVYQAK
jgi:predicted amidohydrolase YtcJ